MRLPKAADQVATDQQNSDTIRTALSGKRPDYWHPVLARVLQSRG